MVKMQSYVRINLAVSKELAEWIRKQAQRENRSINNFVQTVLLKYREEKKQKEEIPCLSVQ